MKEFRNSHQDRPRVVGEFQKQISRRKGGHDRKGVITSAHPWEYHLIKQNDVNRIRHILPSHAMPYLCLRVGSICLSLAFHWGFPGGSDDKESACNAGDLGLIPGFDPLEKGMATHSSILAWRIPWTIESMGSQRVRHD